MATREEVSLSWRKRGENTAFLPMAWEFMSRHYYWAARHLQANSPIALFDFAFACVEWAGRYPTPRWRAEGSKSKWDVPVGEDGVIDGAKIPNTASSQKIDALADLYSRLSQAYKQSGESE